MSGKRSFELGVSCSVFICRALTFVVLVVSRDDVEVIALRLQFLDALIDSRAVAFDHEFILVASSGARAGFDVHQVDVVVAEDAQRLCEHACFILVKRAEDDAC